MSDRFAWVKLADGKLTIAHIYDDGHAYLPGTVFVFTTNPASSDEDEEELERHVTIVAEIEPPAQTAA